MAFSSFSSTHPQTYPQLLGATLKNAVIVITWRVFQEMTGEKQAKLVVLLYPLQAGALLCSPPFFRVKARVLAAHSSFFGIRGRNMPYAQARYEAGEKSSSPRLTSGSFFKLLIFKEFWVCSLYRQRQLFSLRTRTTRFFQAGIHRIIHRFWGKPEKTLFAEVVSVFSVQMHTPSLSPRGRSCPEEAGEGASFYQSPPTPTSVCKTPQGERGAKRGERTHLNQNCSSVFSVQTHTPSLSPRGRGCPAGAGEGVSFYPFPPPPTAVCKTPQGERGAKRSAPVQEYIHSIQNSSSCRHNLNYWQFGDYLGLGAGAHSKLSMPFEVVRETRWREPGTYMQKAAEGGAMETKTAVAADELPFEFLMNALRLVDGFSPSLFTERTGLPLSGITPLLARAEADGLLVFSAEHILPTSTGRRFLNRLLERFLP